MNRNSNSTLQEASVERTVVTNLQSEDLNTKLIIGIPDAEVAIVEYFDYKCPSRNIFHRNVGKEIDEAYTVDGRVNYEIRLTPIIGPDSANTARGAYCANDQGLFAIYHETVLDYMYDIYYEKRNISAEFDNILTTNLLGGLALDIGIDHDDTFTSCVDSDRFDGNLDANLNAATDDSIQGTPGFAIGKRSFVGGQPFSVFETLLDIELR